MDVLSAMNMVDSVIDEIALEGLDGITLEALWSRLAMRFHEKVPLSPQLMEQVWNICLQVKDLSFYELEKERDKLIIFDRYEFVDPDIGIILEAENMPNDIYEHCPVDDWKNGIKGSCSTYYTRKEIGELVKKLNVQEAEKQYGRKLVIVASQTARQNALMDKSVCPTLNLTIMQYCFLERVGRSRYHGEVTQGKLSLAALKEDPRLLFYHRKFLIRHKLMTKQSHHQKSGGYSCSGSLLHLPRFYVERKPKAIYLAEKVIEILKSRENHLAEYSEIKKELKVDNAIKKLFKTNFFQKFVKTNLMVPWRTLYPHAANKEWQCKQNSAREKTLRVVQLVDPNIEIGDLWKDDVIVEDDEPYELDVTKHQYSVPHLRQANKCVEECQIEGMNQADLARKMGLTKIHSRTTFRVMAKMNIVAMYMKDVGRQRVTRYVSRKFESGSELNTQLQRELTKMKKYTEATSNKRNETEVDPPDEDKSPIEQSEQVSNPPVENSETIDSPSSDNNSVNAAAKIIQKYKMKNCSSNYKRTFFNVVEENAPEPKRRKLNSDLEQKDESGENEKSEIDEVYDETRETVEENLIECPPNTIKEPSNEIIGLKDFSNADLKNVPNVTYRLLKRANIIMEIVKEHKIIDDLTKLIKIISEEEEKEGYDGKIDKKSLVRLLQRLARDNLVKNIKLNLKSKHKEKSLTFICDPSIGVNHTVIRSAIEQAKVKFNFIGKSKTVAQPHSNTEKTEDSGKKKNETESIEKLHVKSRLTLKTLSSGLLEDNKAGKRYGYAEKFVRMQTLHSFLFYLTYEHPGKSSESQEELLEKLRSNGVEIDENLEKEMSEIYSTEQNWKMFVPPLPEHNGWPRGWALMCDLVLRMPLSIFLKVHNVTYRLPQLEEYMKHPIRRHLLMKEMPSEIRDVLLMRRRYVYSIHETISRLCYIGLLQFGPHKFKEKEKVFVYVNRNAELLDTTSSAAHYHQIEAKAYPIMRFTFTSQQAIDKYWYKLWSTCINTRLGGRLVVQGKDIVLEDLAKKTEMIEAMQARAPDEAPLRDNGHVPGDRKGAAGLDSAFFAHLKRNWNRESSSHAFQSLSGHVDRERITEEGERDVYLAKVKPKPIRFTDFHGLKKITGPTVIDAGDLKKAQPKNANAWKTKQHRIALAKNVSREKQRSYVRRVLPRRKQVRSRVKYDEIDYNALQHMNKLRVDWDTQEDNILLICKVAMMYLCPNLRRQMIPFTAVRDVLRSYSLTSYNKTSRACQRRLLYMLKQPETHHSVTLGIEELKQDFYVQRRFGNAVEKLAKIHRTVQQLYEQVCLVFRDLVTYIAKKHFNIKDIQTSNVNFAPTTVEEFHLFHNVKYPKKMTSLQGFYEETTNDIHSATINSVIHSSMCCVKDRRSWAYQLFRIYQQYPEWLLRSAMAKIRSDQMVTIKKHYVFTLRKQTNACMPMSSSQYQLSSNYIQKFNTKLPFSVFKEAWDFFYSLAKNYSENYVENVSEKNIAMITTPINGGTIAAIHDYINTNGIELDIEIPQQIIMLDPTFQKDDERYIRIARRYQDILRNFEHVNIDEILEQDYSQESRDEGLEPAPERVEKVDETKNNQQREKLQKLPSQIKSKESKVAPEVRKPRQSKIQDQHENNGNTDNEAVESDRELNFDDEECDDENEELDLEDDECIRFIDGTIIRITREDVENAGFEVPAEVFRSSEASSSKRSTTKESEEKSVSPLRVVQETDVSSTKVEQEVTPMEIDEDSDEPSQDKTKTDFEETSMNIESLENEKLFEADGSESRAVRINELLERAESGKLDRLPCVRTSESNEKRSTRLAMLQMREELNDLASNDTHHAHEYFVLNMFPIFYSLSHKIVQRPDDLTSIHGLRLPSELLPLSRDVYAPAIADLKIFAIYDKASVPYKDFRQDLRASDTLKRGMDAIFEFIQSKREVGADIRQLFDKFYSILGDELYEALSILKENRFLLRSGVTNTRYIHQKYTDPWLIHSYKIMRLQKESLQTVTPGSLYVVSDEKGEEKEKENDETKNEAESNEKTEINDSVESHEITDVMEEDEICEPKKNEQSPDVSEVGKSNQGKMQKSRTCLLPTKDIYRAAKQLDLDTAEEIKVVVRPWIRIDGALNRRVLDRMLGAVLAYCLAHPGVYLTKVQEKFAPAIQPFHTKELVELLMKMGCLQMGTMKKTRVTLLSKSSSTKPAFSRVPERGEVSEDRLVIEPVLGATLKFSVFLSNRTYTSDFLS